jgi:hypothetical protein
VRYGHSGAIHVSNANLKSGIIHAGKNCTPQPSFFLFAKEKDVLVILTPIDGDELSAS